MERSVKLPHATLIFFILVLYRSTTVDSSQYPTSTTIFASFNDSDRSRLEVLGDAAVNNNALQITPDARVTFPYLVNKSGRVLLRSPIKIWHLDDSATTSVASFNTSFLMNIIHDNDTVPAEGIAFLIAPNLDLPPPGSNKGYLGLTNSTLDGSPSNHFVAVEFDTFKQSYDRDDNHVGLDINSVNSSVSASLAPFGIRITPNETTTQHVWIEYDGVARFIKIFMATKGRPKPNTTVLNASLDLSAHLLQWSYFGFAASTGDKYQLNCLLSWNITVEVLPDDDEDGSWPAWKLVIVILVPLLSVVVAILGGWYWFSRSRDEEDPKLLAGTLKCLPGMPQEFTFKELKKATNNFDEGHKLGQGGFGIVYKGILSGCTLVAVKKFSRDRLKGQDDFLSELTIINRLRHKHLVRLVGWCHRKNVLLLVYDYMPNGSLDQHLFGGVDRPILSWERRYNIVVGVASALQYLHNEYDQKVVHRDLKASNVMLDERFNARLGDFGLARALDTDKTSYVDADVVGVAGTVGYIAPECFHTGKATRDSDLYGFGAVVLEVACGRRPRCEVEGFHYLVDWVWKLHREGRILEALDPRLGEEYVVAEAERLLLLGLACSHPIAAERPKAQVIVQILSGSVPTPQVPPFKPAFMWPARVFSDDTATTTATTTATMSSSSSWAPR